MSFTLNKKNITLIFIILGIAVALFFYIFNRVYSLNGNRIEKIKIENNIFYAEVVSDVNKMQKGLGKRDNLCKSCAMLFEFSSSGRYTFSMKDMRFPLDIIWILNDKVVYIRKNIPKDFDGILVPPFNADRVLEINAGLSDKLSIKMGDKIFQ